MIRRLKRDAGWTQPLPMWSWIIETASERILVDAGGAPGATGGVTQTRFDITPDHSLVAELVRLNLKPEDFDRVLLTHLHGDHVGGLGAFASNKVWVSRPEWAPVASFPGRLMRPLTAPVPRGFSPRVFDFDGPAQFGFPASWPVTRDGSIQWKPSPRVLQSAVRTFLSSIADSIPQRQIRIITILFFLKSSSTRNLTLITDTT